MSHNILNKPTVKLSFCFAFSINLNIDGLISHSLTLHIKQMETIFLRQLGFSILLSSGKILSVVILSQILLYQAVNVRGLPSLPASCF